MDNQIYSIGKGPSAITATVQNDQITNGNSVLITGKVTDVSAGTKSPTLTARFPEGVPAVSDDSMTDWMQYVYMQMPKPTNTTGVTVNLEVIDANGNLRPIGETTADADGFYSFNWKPDISGGYTVIATFQGSESYWPSHTETAFVVNDAAPTPTAQPIAAQPPTEMYFAISTIAIIAAIAVIGGLIMVMLKKRP